LTSYGCQKALVEMRPQGNHSETMLPGIRERMI
jgi:hypothetical protein